MADHIIRSYKDFSEIENGIHLLEYAWGKDSFSYERQISGAGNIRKVVQKELTDFFIVEKGSSFSCLFFDRAFTNPKRYFVTDLNDTSSYDDEENLNDYIDNKNHTWFFLNQFCRWTDSEETDVRILVHGKNGYIVGFITKDGAPADSVIAREYYKGLLVKKTINELLEEPDDYKTWDEEEEDILADIERLSEPGEEVSLEKSMPFPRFGFRSKICASCDKPFKIYDFIVRIEGEREFYCPECARKKLLDSNDNERHGRYLGYICTNVGEYTVARLVINKRIFSELGNGLYELKQFQYFGMPTSKMLYGRRKYIHETVKYFASLTICNGILEKNDDFVCLFFGYYKRWEESFFIKPYGEIKELMDHLAGWTEMEVNLLVDRDGYVFGFICGSDTCDESIIVREYYGRRFVVKRIRDLK